MKNDLLTTKNTRDTFIGCFKFQVFKFIKLVIEKDEDTSELENLTCVQGHVQSKYLRQVAFTLFNIQKLCIRVQIHSSKKRKAPAANSSKSARKVRKLQSQGST